MTVSSPPAPAAIADAPTRQNTLAVVVTYHPDDAFLDRLATIAKQVDRVVVVDNGSACGLAARVIGGGLGNTTVVENPDNRGIATALNQGCRHADSARHAWVLTMDQDSRAHDDMVAGLSAVFVACPFRSEVAVVAANFVDRERRRLFVGTGAVGSVYLEQPAAITSGSLVRASALREIGPFRDDYFIDFVDHEFCLRLRKKKWRVIYSRRPLLDHSIGAPQRHKLLWMRPATSNHSPLRRYYITRNRLVTSWTYADTEPRAVISDLWRIGGELAVLVLFEQQKREKLWAVVRGVVDAATGRMGKRF